MANDSFSSLNEALSSFKQKEDPLIGNKVANFAYDNTAYEDNDADGVETYNYARHNNIPKGESHIIDTNQSVLNKGFRSQASSITRMLMNHFFGRVSFNLNKTVEVVDGLVNQVQHFMGRANGLATLDTTGRIPYSQLPESAIEFKGLWNAETNTPELKDGTGTNGDFYIVSVAGTVNFGTEEAPHTVSFFINDRVIYDGSTWSRLSSGDVKSVNGVLPVAGDIKNVITLTQSQYEQIPSNDKLGKFFIVKTDSASGLTVIDDATISLDSTWSSRKITTDMQYKLTAGSNINIDENAVISCDINTMNFKGAVDTYAELPTEGVVIGDVWNVRSTNDTYCWNGTEWVGIGSSVDLSGYVSSNVDNSKLWKGTKAEYDAIETKDPNTTYVITDEDSEHSFVVDTNALSPSVFMRDVGTICDTNADVADKEVVINQFALVRGAVLKVLFTNANTAENPTISVKSSDGYVYADKIAIKAVRGGEKIVPVVHSGKWRGADAYTDEMWQPYTTIEVMYDGTDWVIMGNPLFESYVSESGDKGYSVYADGLVEQGRRQYDIQRYLGFTWAFDIKFINKPFEIRELLGNAPSSAGGNPYYLNDTLTNSSVDIWGANQGQYLGTIWAKGY